MERMFDSRVSGVHKIFLNFRSKVNFVYRGIPGILSSFDSEVMQFWTFLTPIVPLFRTKSPHSLDPLLSKTVTSYTDDPFT